MVKKLFFIFILLLSTNVYAQICDVTIDGFGYCKMDVLEFNSMPEPSVSPTGKARIFFDIADMTLKCSEDGSAYSDCFGAGGGSSIILDLDDDGSNESTALSEIAVINDTLGAFTEPTANKLLIDVSKLGTGSGGSCWEDNGSSGIMPVSGTCTDTLWEDNGSGGIMPKV